MVQKHVHIVLPEGTKVLVRHGGRVGVVSQPEEAFKRSDLTIFKHAQDEIPGAPAPTSLLSSCSTAAL